MFHQHNNGSTACYGSEVGLGGWYECNDAVCDRIHVLLRRTCVKGSGHVWGHASSPDLVHWTRRPLTSHMVSTHSQNEGQCFGSVHRVAFAVPLTPRVLVISASCLFEDTIWIAFRALHVDGFKSAPMVPA